MKKRTTCDSQKWNEELERYSGGKYQDERMRVKARKELEEWEEKVKRRKIGTGEQRAPRLAKWYCGCLTILMEMQNETRSERISTLLLSLRKEEVPLRFLLPLDWWRQLPRNGELIWISLFAQWM